MLEYSNTRDSANARESHEEPEKIQHPPKKRQRRDEAEFQLDPFSLILSPLSEVEVTIQATGLCVIPRCHLPLSFLDSQSLLGPSLFPLPFFYSANIQWSVTGRKPYDSRQVEEESKALIAELDGELNLYAIERLEDHVHSVCRLASWVKIGHFEQLVQRPRQIYTSTPEAQVPATHTEWWSSLILSSHGEQLLSNQRNQRVMSDGGIWGSDTTPDAHSKRQFSVADQEGQPRLAKALSSVESKPSQSLPEDNLKHLIGQYLNALYISKTSLAYFSKGPLSRTRAAFNEINKLNDLLDILGNLVLNVPTLDKKYKVTIPEIIRSNKESGAHTTTNTKRKWRSKPGKDGLFSNEADFITSWWQDTEQGFAYLDENAFAARLTGALSRIRYRETLLQIILILESLSVDAMISAKGVSIEDSDDAHREESNDAKVASHTSLSKAKKPRDRHKHLDALLDRLTIWQSVDSTNPASENGNIRDMVGGQENRGNGSKDQLNDFCSQVILPFYGARLPLVVERITKKLGVVSGISPSRPSTSTATTRTRKVAPGTELPRQRHPKSPSKANEEHNNFALNGELQSRNVAAISRRERRPLSRSQSINQPIESRVSLSRSASLSRQKDQDRSLSRSGSINQNNQNLKQREVDFSAIGKFYQAKQKRKLDVEQELKDAITALKKPNRDLAGKEYMKAAEERVTSAKTQNSLHPLRRKRGTAFEVSATPKTLTTKSCVTATPSKSIQQAPMRSPETRASLLDLSRQHTPATFKGTRQAGTAETIISSTPAGKPAPGPLSETPLSPGAKASWRARAAKEFGQRGSEQNALFQTPSKGRYPSFASGLGAGAASLSTPKQTTEAAHADLQVVNSSAGSPCDDHSDALVVAAAAVTTMTTTTTTITNDAQPRSNNELPKSIYETLGWDVDELM